MDTYPETTVRELTRELIDCPKAFAEDFLRGAVSTLHQQLNGSRALALRTVHLAQAQAGRWPVYGHLLSLTGVPVGERSVAAVRDETLCATLTRTTAELGDVARALGEAQAPGGAGGPALALDEWRRLERETLELVQASMALLAVLRVQMPPRNRTGG